MGKLTIIGNDKPVIGKQEMYSVSSVNDWLNLLNSVKNPLPLSQTHWEVMVQTKTGWRKGGSHKEGQVVPYIFGQKSLLHKGIKIVVQQGNDKGELVIHPQRANEPKITRVELLDANYKPIPKGKKLSYKDTIIARAYGVEMFGMQIAFTLWEDDAQGEGHNPTVNALNKINPVPVLSRVNEKGMAEAVFRLPFYTMAVLIANTRTAQGEKSEGPTHEYYVTADVVSKHIQKASPNVNVVNPTYNPEPPRQRELPKKQKPSPTKPKTTPAPEKPKPKPDSPKFPVTTGGKKSDDPQGRILSAEFVDNNGNRLHSSKVGTTVRIKIVAKKMKDKKVKVKIWEEDNFTWTNDMIFEKDYILIGDNNYINNVQLTKKMFDKAKDGGSDSSRQDYFIEVIDNNTSVTSGVMPVSIDAAPTKVESGESATAVEKTKLETKNCGGKYCIDKNSPPSELIREINIRLAGFGGNVPTDKFTDRTERMIKQFQRDYMKVPETGKVCGNVLKAIDEFSKHFEISTILWNQLKCSCSTKGKKVTSTLRGIQEINSCNGFGDGTGKNTYKGTATTEANNKYEYPGIHRSLLFGFKALQFYFSKQKTYKIDQFTSGYRCRFKNYTTTNHQGKAIDIQFSKGNWQIRGENKKNLVELRTMRDSIFVKYLGAQKEWPNTNLFSIEPIDLLYNSKGKVRYDHTFSWIHIDVRQFDSLYLEDQYFCTSLAKLNGKNIVQLAIELGYNKTCNCYETYQSQQNKQNNTLLDTCEDKFKKIAPIILKHEGGYKNEPSKDKGDTTNRGISWPVWQKYAKEDLGIEPTKENQKKITEEQATIIYRKRYWEPKGYCEVKNLKVALMVYDWSITSGGAIKEVQKLLVNEFNQTITVDGGMGKETANALNQPEDQEKLLIRISEIRKAYYNYGASQNWFSEDYLKGLKIRVDKCLNYKL